MSKKKKKAKRGLAHIGTPIEKDGKRGWAKGWFNYGKDYRKRDDDSGLRATHRGQSFGGLNFNYRNWNPSYVQVNKEAIEKHIKLVESTKLPAKVNKLNDAVAFVNEWYDGLTVTREGMPKFVIGLNGFLRSMGFDERYDIRTFNSTDSYDSTGACLTLKHLNDKGEMVKTSSVPPTTAVRGATHLVYLGKFCLTNQLTRDASYLVGLSDGLTTHPAISLMTMNGTMIHELGHVRYTNVDIANVQMACMAHATKIFGFSFDGHVNTIIQIGEDLYIENRLALEFPVIYPFVIFKNEVMFSHHDAVTVGKNNNTDPVSKLMNMIYHLKQMSADELIALGAPPQMKDVEDVYATYFNSPDSITESQRIEGINKILDILLGMHNETRKKKGEGKADQELKHNSNTQPGAGESRSNADPTAKRPDFTAAEDSESEQTIKLLTVMEENNSEAAEGDNEGGEQPINIHVTSSGGGAYQNIIAEQLAPQSNTEYEPVKENNYAGVAQKLRYVKTRNRTYRDFNDRSGRLVGQRISRIITDGKVFGRQTEDNRQFKDYAFTLLLDNSGSMAGGNMRRAIEAGYHFWNTLRDARVPVSVYGHAADVKGFADSTNGFGTVVYKYAGYEDPKTMVARRFETFRANNDRELRTHPTMGHSIHLLGNNRDGVAIETVSEIAFKQAKPSARKVIIVVSDGAPAARGYQNGSQHTKETVNRLREKGFLVFSISIVSYAAAYNDDIYGREFNTVDGPEAAIDIIKMLAHV